MPDSPNSLHLSVYRRIPGWWTRDILFPFLLTRLALTLVAWLGFRLLPLTITFPATWEIGPDGNRQPIAAHVSPSSHPLVNMWSRWDAYWYLEIEKEGYKYEANAPNNVAFYPLYPLLVRAIQTILFLPATDYWLLVAGITAANFCLLIALTYLRALVAQVFSGEVAARTILYLLVFPTNFFFSATYTESLFLALTVAAFYYGHNNRWPLACLCAGLAVLTRSQGIILLAPLTYDYFAQRKFSWRKIDWNLASFLLPPAALGSLICYFHLKFRSWTVLFDSQRWWKRHFVWPWHPVAWFFRHAPTLSITRHDRLDFAFLVLLLVLAVAGFRLLPRSYSIYCWAAAFFFSCWGQFGSLPRFDLVVFPIFIVLAVIGIRSRYFHLAYLVVAAMLAALFMVMYSQWNWVA